MEKQVNYLLTYRCEECGMESAFAEKDTPRCRYCDRETTLIVVKKQEITSQLLEDHIKALSESMLTNLEQAYHQMTENEKELFPEGPDAEKEMLVLLAKVKSLKDKISGMEFNDPEESRDKEHKE